MSIKVKRFLEGIRALQSKNSNVTQFKFINCEKQYNCEIQEWNRQKFRIIYPKFSLKNVFEEFNTHIGMPEQTMGKRGSQITISQTKLYCLKIINKEDFDYLVSIFDDYTSFIKERNPKQIYFTPLLGVFKVKTQDAQHKHNIQDIFLLMPCLITQFDDLIGVYDIKGYCQGRVVDKNDAKDLKYGKDQNFFYSKQLSMVKSNLSNEFKSEFVRIFDQHANFLTKRQIIDYSLLIVFYIKKIDSKQSQQSKVINEVKVYDNVWMKFGIIDYLQVYNKMKKLQNAFKSMFKKDISSVEPEIYLKRFHNFLSQALEIQ